MILTAEKEIVRSQSFFEVGTRVLYVVQFNNPGYYAPGEKLPGTIISLFKNQGSIVYRIRLDERWNEDFPLYGGKNIIVGNITRSSLVLLLE